MTLEFDVDMGYITDDGSKDMPQWVKLNDEDGQHPSTIYVNNDSYQRSISENAKLRKLLLDVWNDAMQFDGFWDYVMDDGEIYNEDELPHYQERMRELGIEVDE